MAKSRILIVDDDQSLRRVLEVQLEQEGYAVASAASAQQALSMMQLHSYDLMITDLKMPDISGIALLQHARSRYPETIVIILTAFGSVESAVEAMKAGAYDYLTKPVHPDELSLIARRALQHSHLIKEVRALRASLNKKYGFDNILGHSDALVQILDTASRAAVTNSTILIRGETGTGKELLAKAIHFNSARKERPFVTINCAAIPKELLESELFGHKKGAFTGAVADKRGKIEMADEGTLFLDEIGDMPLELQVKVLRLIQEGEIEKLGSVGSEKLDVRIIAATHRDLQAMIEDGMFREDLYYRLAVIPLTLPPLRERPEDIAELVQHFFSISKEKNNRPGLAMPPALLRYFAQYRWPGNIRELENVVERVVALARGDVINVQDLPPYLRPDRGGLDSVEIDLPPQGVSLDAIEKELIMKALEKCSWNQTHAARYLDISRKTLIYRMERHGIHKPAGFHVPSD